MIITDLPRDKYKEILLWSLEEGRKLAGQILKRKHDWGPDYPKEATFTEAELEVTLSIALQHGWEYGTEHSG